MSEVEVRPPLMAAKGNSDNTFANTKLSAKVRKTGSVNSRNETEVPATKVTEEEHVPTKAVVNEETPSKTGIPEHSNDIVINKGILKGGISDVLHLEIDRKQGQAISLTTESDTGKLINDPGNPSSRNEQETNTNILGEKKGKTVVLSSWRGKSDNVLKSSRHVKSVVSNSNTYNPSELIKKFDKHKTKYTHSYLTDTASDITTQGVRMYRSVNKHIQNSERVPGILKQDDDKQNSSLNHNASFETGQRKSNFSNILNSTGEATLSGMATILGYTTPIATTTLETTTAMAITTMETATKETTTMKTTSMGTTTLTTTKRAAKSLGMI